MSRELGNDDLAKKVAARRVFLKKAIEFILSVVNKRGVLKSKRVGSCNIHTVEELTNFSGFSFVADTGHTMFGGNDVWVWHHPDGYLSSEELSKARAVLHVYWGHDLEKNEVKVFAPDTRWQTALFNIIKSRKKIEKKEDKKLASLKKECQAEESRRQEQARVEKEAKRLGL